MTRTLIGRPGRWATAAATVLALGSFGIGMAVADPDDGISGGMNTGNNGGFNVGPNGVSGGGGENDGANVNVGPFGGGWNSNTAGGAEFGR